SGVITMEDILEEVVGNIQDEYDNEEEEVTAIDETTYEVDGGTKLDELVEELEDWGLIFPEDDYDTLGGFILFKLGYIPEDGQFDSIVHDNLRYTILNMDERRVGRVKIERMQVEE
ncbi:MAG: HlyC/CorC family transporter, partial [Oscillospiraceae bacterium]|nr:HlyC/CorC family transporter [Oscillospiraceae bacterium]